MPNNEVTVNVTFEKVEVEEKEETTKEEPKVDSTVSGEGEKLEQENPNTSDAVSTAILILSVSLIGVASTLYIKKKYN